MAVKQSRRTVSLSTPTYDAFAKAAKKIKLPMSRLLTDLLDGTPVTGPKRPTAIGKAKAKGTATPQPRTIVNVDLVVTATSEKEAREKVEALIRKMKLEGSVVGVDDDTNYEKAPPSRVSLAKVG